jgi:hypothetical protein
MTLSNSAGKGFNTDNSNENLCLNFCCLLFIGCVKIIHSCGREGFKNTREGTNIAAQATGITLATV